MKSSTLIFVLLGGGAVQAGSLLPPKINRTDPESWKYSHLRSRQALGYLTWAIGMCRGYEILETCPADIAQARVERSKTPLLLWVCKRNKFQLLHPKSLVLDG
jgi:hypothetical protein